ncbi:hypothetical protein [Halospeciosus flavus]|uniref:hypothetical protein n=1 Tax=Halospeciosus flavus TaxID=3032283 RepID=UPI002AA29BB2|nr:hypothetical protein [Halospeciosus flavus]
MSILDEICEEPVSEEQDEERADEIKDEIEECVSWTIDDENRFETESPGDNVNEELENLPTETNDHHGGEHARGRSLIPTASNHMNETAEQRRRMRMREVIPPPDFVVGPTHPDGVCEHRDFHVDSLPRPELDTDHPLDDPWEK